MNFGTETKRINDAYRQREQYQNWLMRHGKHWHDNRQQTFEFCFEADWREALAA